MKKLCHLLALGVFSFGIHTHACAQQAPLPYTNAVRFDAMGRSVGTISADPDGAGTGNPFLATRTTYSSGGLVIKVEQGTLSAWQSPDVEPRDWVGFVVSSSLETSYDQSGRKTTEQTRGSDNNIYAIKQFSYDALGRLECLAVRMTPAASQPASACSQVTTPGSNGPDRITKNVYDSAGQLVQVRNGVGTPIDVAEATYSYTPNSKRSYVIDGNGNRAQFTYDAFDRLYQWVFPSTTRPSSYDDSTQGNALASAGSINTGDYEQYSYDNNGNRLTLKKRDNSTINYSYDYLNRVTHKGGPIADVDYTYDLDGHQLSALFSSGGTGVTNTYTGFGELKTTTANYQGPSLTLSYEYDADGNRCKLAFPDNQTFTYSFDQLDRQTGIYQGGTCSSLGIQLANLAYDESGPRKALLRTGAGSSTYNLDPIGRLQSLVNDLAGTSSDHTLTFGYNSASQIISKAASNDAFVWTGTYNVNRGYTTNGLNQYSAAGTAAFCYDPNGNLTADGTSVFRYDAENRLYEKRAQTSTTCPTASTGYDGLQQAGLGYDPTGRMVVAYSPSNWTRLVYDGDDLVAEYSNTGSLLRRYLHGPGEDEPLIQYEGSDLSSRRYLHADQQGSVIASTDSAGNMMSINRYDEYGVPQNNSGRFQYTGQQWANELGMYYYKARFYSPTLGRFMQTDPIGYTDQANLYAYVKDDPTSQTDPSGEQSVPGTLSVESMCNGSTDCAQSAHEGLFQVGSVVGPFMVAPELIAPKIISLIGRGLGAGRAAEGVVAVIGHYPAYTELAAATGGRVFSVPAKIWERMTPAQQWAANVKFLDRQIAQGASFRLATPANQARAGSAFEKEIKYIQSRGYQLSKDGKRLENTQIRLCVTSGNCR